MGVNEVRWSEWDSALWFKINSIDDTPPLLFLLR